MSEIRFIGGPVGGQRANLSREPLRLEVLGTAYERVDDPDTGESLGAYCAA